MRFILDTDMLSILQQKSEPAYSRLLARLSECAPHEVGTTIVSFQERLQGWMAVINRPRSEKRLLEAYAELQEILRDFSRTPLLPYDESAQARFRDLGSKQLTNWNPRLKNR